MNEFSTNTTVYYHRRIYIYRFNRQIVLVILIEMYDELTDSLFSFRDDHDSGLRRQCKIAWFCLLD